MKQRVKYVHEGQYAVAVTVEIIEPAPGWEQCISVEDALKLDDTRSALRAGNIQLAAQFGQVYHLTPLSA